MFLEFNKSFLNIKIKFSLLKKFQIKMSSASNMSMPLLITNLGVEMIYVLCSRLKAQNIPTDKSSKVINDVVISLFDKKFMTEIRKKQQVNNISK